MRPTLYAGLLALVSLAAPPARADAPAGYAEATLAGQAADTAISESSGIVAGRRNKNVLWTHNDSGGKPAVYALGPGGERLGTFTALGAVNSDWEDIAAAKIGAVDYLLLADIGDNERRRVHCTFYLLPEPAVDPLHPRAGQGAVKRTVRFTYPEGPQDCEAVGVDPTTNEAILVTKVLLGPARVYSVPLESDERGVVQATLLTSVFMNMVTGMDISPDGRRLLIVTYGPAYEFTRAPGQPWAQALKTAPRTVILPKRKQGESICYDADGSTIWLTSEGVPCPLWRIDPRR